MGVAIPMGVAMPIGVCMPSVSSSSTLLVGEEGTLMEEIAGFDFSKAGISWIPFLSLNPMLQVHHRMQRRDLCAVYVQVKT